MSRRKTKDIPDGIQIATKYLRNGRQTAINLYQHMAAKWKVLMDAKNAMLIRATGRSDLETVKAAVSYGADANARDMHLDVSALGMAAARGDVEAVKFLISAGADVDASGSGLQTPLLVAVKNGHKDVVRILLENGTELNKTDAYGWTAMDYAIASGRQDIADLFKGKAGPSRTDSGGPLIFAIAKGQEDVVENMIKCGADVNSTFIGETPLIRAARKGYAGIVTSLIAAGADVNVLDAYGVSALSWAVIYNHMDVFKILLGCGADMNAARVNGDTPLHLAVNRVSVEDSRQLLSCYEFEDVTEKTDSHVEMAKILIERGAEINLQNFQLHTPLHFAVHRDNADLVAMLIEYGADIETKDIYGCTALSSAVKSGHEKIMDILLKNGADIYTRDEKQSTLIHLAVRNGHANIVNSVLALDGSFLEAKDDDEMTPLLVAVNRGNMRLVELLVAANANANAKNKFGQTPLSVAVSCGYESMVEILLRAGADANAKDIYGRTAVFEAAAKGEVKLLEILIAANTDATSEDIDNNTPLHFPIYRNKSSIIKLLFDSLVDVDVVNTYNETALKNAAGRNDKEAVELFIRQSVLQNPGCAPPEFLNDDRSDLWNSCQNEVRLMKRHALGETTITVYKLLAETDKDKVVHYLNTVGWILRGAQNLAAFYPKYHEAIQEKIEKGAERRTLLNKTVIIMKHSDMKILPDEMKLYITRFLHKLDCKKFIRAAMEKESQQREEPSE